MDAVVTTKVFLVRQGGKWWTDVRMPRFVYSLITMLRSDDVALWWNGPPVSAISSLPGDWLLISVSWSRLGGQEEGGQVPAVCFQGSSRQWTELVGRWGSSCNANWCRAPGVTAELPATLSRVVHYISRFGSQLVLRWQVLSPNVTSRSLVACYNNRSCVLSVTTRDLGYCHTKRSCVLRAITPNLASCDCVYQVRKGQEIVYAADMKTVYILIFVLFLFLLLLILLISLLLCNVNLLVLHSLHIPPPFFIILLCKVSCVWKCNDLVLLFHYDSEHKPPKFM